MKKYGILKGYKNGLYGSCDILLMNEINNEYTIQDFHEDRCNTIDKLINEYSNFETSLK